MSLNIFIQQLLSKIDETNQLVNELKESIPQTPTNKPVTPFVLKRWFTRASDSIEVDNTGKVAFKFSRWKYDTAWTVQNVYWIQDMFGSTDTDFSTVDYFNPQNRFWKMLAPEANNAVVGYVSYTGSGFVFGCYTIPTPSLSRRFRIHFPEWTWVELEAYGFANGTVSSKVQVFINDMYDVLDITSDLTTITWIAELYNSSAISGSATTHARLGYYNGIVRDIVVQIQGFSRAWLKIKLLGVYENGELIVPTE